MSGNQQGQGQNQFQQKQKQDEERRKQEEKDNRAHIAAEIGNAQIDFDKFKYKYDSLNIKLLEDDKKKKLNNIKKSIEDDLMLINSEKNIEQQKKILNRLNTSMGEFKRLIERNEAFIKNKELKERIKAFFQEEKAFLSLTDLGYKIIRIAISVFAIKLGTSRMNIKYIENVVAQDIEPPSLTYSLGLMFVMDVIFNLSFLATIYILGQRNAYINEVFNTNYNKFLLDYSGYLLVFLMIGGILTSQFSNKKYFRYREDGTRGIRALEEILIYISIILHLIPFYAIANLFTSSSESGSIHSIVKDLLDKTDKFNEKKDFTNEKLNIIYGISSDLLNELPKLLLELRNKVNKEEIEASFDSMRIKLNELTDTYNDLKALYDKSHLIKSDTAQDIINYINEISKFNVSLNDIIHTGSVVLHDGVNAEDFKESMLNYIISNDINSLTELFKQKINKIDKTTNYDHSRGINKAFRNLIHYKNLSNNISKRLNELNREKDRVKDQLEGRQSAYQRRNQSKYNRSQRMGKFVPMYYGRGGENQILGGADLEYTNNSKKFGEILSDIDRKFKERLSIIKQEVEMIKRKLND